jgi:secreted trypsin-like serine protease
MSIAVEHCVSADAWRFRYVGLKCEQRIMETRETPLKKLLILLGALAMALTMALPAGAITDGEPTADHPEVVLILMEVDGAPAFRCSGTLIAPTFVLTAGHCTNNFPGPGTFTGMRVFTEADVDNGDNNYPIAGPNAVEAIRWEAHPDYETAPFFVNDVGMIELDTPIVLSDYGDLPELDSLDAYAKSRGKNKARFTSVGYGLQRINPVFIEAARERYIAHPKLNAINAPGMTGDFSLLLSNNHSTGGTCFGDSGGPNFIDGVGDGTVVAGVTSFGLNGNCAGTGGVFRVDRKNVQDFINGFMNP